MQQQVVRMHVIRADAFDPYMTFALHETLATNGTIYPTLMFSYFGQLAVSISRDQLIDDIDAEYCERAGIPIVRRESGGAALLHHPGDVTFCYASKERKIGGRLPGHYVCVRILDALANSSVTEAFYNGHSSVFIGTEESRRKLSNTASYMPRTSLSPGVYVHGTLFNASVGDRSGFVVAYNKVTKQPPDREIEIRDLAFLSDHVSVDAMLENFAKSLATDRFSIGKLQPSELRLAEELAADKYRTPDWRNLTGRYRADSRREKHDCVRGARPSHPKRTVKIQDL